MKQFSEISKSAFVKDTATLDHPVHISPHVEIHGESTVGRYTFINIGTVIYSHVSIGRYCSIARNCEIGAANHPIHFLSTHTFTSHGNCFPHFPEYQNIRRQSWRFHQPTLIGNDVWIGAKVIIKSGVSIGDGVIVAAGSVVSKSIPPYSIVGGVPAKLIRMRFPASTISKLIQLQWWRLDIGELNDLSFNDIDSCINDLLKKFQKNTS